MEADKSFPTLVHAYKVSKFMKTIKFSIEVPQTTRQAFEMDESDGNNLWSQAMDSEIKSLHAHDTFKVLEMVNHSQQDTKEFLIIAFMMSNLILEEIVGLLLEVI